MHLDAVKVVDRTAAVTANVAGRTRDASMSLDVGRGTNTGKGKKAKNKQDKSKNLAVEVNSRNHPGTPNRQNYTLLSCTLAHLSLSRCVCIGVLCCVVLCVTVRIGGLVSLIGGGSGEAGAAVSVSTCPSSEPTPASLPPPSPSSPPSLPTASSTASVHLDPVVSSKTALEHRRLGRLSRLPHVRQRHAWDCGLACTEMVLR